MRNLIFFLLITCFPIITYSQQETSTGSVAFRVIQKRSDVDQVIDEQITDIINGNGPTLVIVLPTITTSSLTINAATFNTPAEASTDSSTPDNISTDNASDTEVPITNNNVIISTPEGVVIDIAAIVEAAQIIVNDGALDDLAKTGLTDSGFSEVVDSGFSDAPNSDTLPIDEESVTSEGTSADVGSDDTGSKQPNEKNRLKGSSTSEGTATLVLNSGVLTGSRGISVVITLPKTKNTVKRNPLVIIVYN